MSLALAAALILSQASWHLCLSLVFEESDMHMSTSSTYDMVIDVDAGVDSKLGSIMLWMYAPKRYGLRGDSWGMPLLMTYSLRSFRSFMRNCTLRFCDQFWTPV